MTFNFAVSFPPASNVLNCISKSGLMVWKSSPILFVLNICSKYTFKTASIFPLSILNNFLIASAKAPSIFNCSFLEESVKPIPKARSNMSSSLGVFVSSHVSADVVDAPLIFVFASFKSIDNKNSFISNLTFVFSIPNLLISRCKYPFE